MEIITVPEVAKMLSLSEITVYRLAKLGKIPARKVGRCWRFSKQAIEKWLSCQPSWEEEFDALMTEGQSLGKSHGITEEAIKKTILEVRQKNA